MDKFSDISKSTIIILFIIVLIMFYHYTDSTDVISELDSNGDGNVSRAELKYYLNNVVGSKCVKKDELMRKTKLGLIKGFLMGFILSDFEGGIVLGLVSGVLNPLLHSMEVRVL